MAPLPDAGLPRPLALVAGHAGLAGAPRPRPSDRRDLFLFSDPERGPAAASRGHVRGVALEARTLEPVDEVDHRTPHVGQARGVDQQTDTLVLEDGVAGA